MGIGVNSTVPTAGRDRVFGGIFGTWRMTKFNRWHLYSKPLKLDTQQPQNTPFSWSTRATTHQISCLTSLKHECNILVLNSRTSTACSEPGTPQAYNRQLRPAHQKRRLSRRRYSSRMTRT